MAWDCGDQKWAKPLGTSLSALLMGGTQCPAPTAVRGEVCVSSVCRGFSLWSFILRQGGVAEEKELITCQREREHREKVRDDIPRSREERDPGDPQ